MPRVPRGEHHSAGRDFGPPAAHPGYVRSPLSRLLLVYLVGAHLSLLTAGVMVATNGDALATSTLHPRTLAVVHLVTLGWLTAIALGALYAVPPLALRTKLTVRWPDFVAAFGVLIGASGVIAHLWLGTYGGVTWSGGMIGAGALWVMVRALAALRDGAAPRVQRAALALALTGLLTTATLGILAALGRSRPVLSAGPIYALAAHAHVGLIGWLGLLTIGVGHRLLPMLVPAAMPDSRRAALSLTLATLTAIALPTSWLWQPATPALHTAAAVPLLVAVGLFAVDVATMFVRRKPKARSLPRVDPALLAVGSGIVCLLAATVLGFVLLIAPWHTAWIATYGALALLGGFSSLVLGVSLRLWPLVLAVHGHVPPRQPPPVPGELPSLHLQWTAVLGWLFAMPCVAAGAACGDASVARIGGVAWSLAAMAATGNVLRVWRRADDRRADVRPS